MPRFRTALINPPDVFRRGYEGEDSTAPLGLAYIAAVLRQSGFATDLFDLAAVWPADGELLERHGFFDYDLYGFTAYSKCFEAALEVLKLLRSHNRTATVVFGGPHASPCAEALLREYADIDCVITHEGELPMLELARYLRDEAPKLETIPNFVWRSTGLSRVGDAPDSASFSIVHNKDYYAVRDLNELPDPVRDYKIEPDRSSFSYIRRDQGARDVQICSSRGCPKRCTFCSIIVSSPTYRVRSVESLMSEIKRLYKKQAFGHIEFVDANFFVASERTRVFAHALYDWKAAITWSGTATADMVVRHADVLEEIGKLNCVRLEVGIESGSSTQLARYNKRTTLAHNMEAIQLLHRAKISLGLDFIMFDPEVTLMELRENLTFLFEAELWGSSPPSCLFNGLRLYPGTPARERYLEMFGLSDYHLANIQPTFLNAVVSRFYALVQEYFNNYQQQTNDAMISLQELLRHGELLPRQRQYIAALVIKLQHEPYRFFDQTLTLFESEIGWQAASLDDLPDCQWKRRWWRLLTQAQKVLRHPSESCQREREQVRGKTGLSTAVTVATDIITIQQNQSLYLVPPSAKPVRLNFPASFAWRKLTQGHCIDRVCAAYSRRFRLSPVTAKQEVIGFLEQMIGAKYLLPRPDTARQIARAESLGL